MIISFITSSFDFILYRPLFNLLILIYIYLPFRSFGLAIIILTFLIRLVMHPLSVKALKSQFAMQRIQPKIQELQKKYKDDKERQTREMLELYRSERVNPFSGIFLIIIQLPILIALYQVFRHGLAYEELSRLYPFVPNPGSLNYIFLGLIDLTQSHNIIMAALAGIVQFFQTKMVMVPPPSDGQKKNADMASMMQKQMLYLMPVMTAVIMYTLPSALSLYIIASGVAAIIQQYFIIKKNFPTGIQNNYNQNIKNDK